MKKILVVALVLILALAIAVTAFGAEKKYKVGYSCISWTIPWMVYYKQLFEQEMKKYPNYEVIWHDAKFDFKAMADGLEGFAAQDVDLIIHFALDNKPMLETYKKIKAAGIPLLLTMDPPDYAAYEYMAGFSGLDNLEAGRICENMLEKALGGKGKVALITAPNGSASEMQYTAGFMNEHRRLNSALEVVTKQSGEWDPAKAQAAASDILTKYPKIDGFYVSDDYMGGGLIRALKEKGYKPGQVKIAANGGSKIGINDFKGGWYLGIVDQGPVLCMKQDIWLMRALLEDQIQIPAFAAVLQEVINKDNISRFPGTW
jgi:ribose transport system substrate-binding protein